MTKKTPLAIASTTLLALALGGCASTGMDAEGDSPDAMSDTSTMSGSAGSTMASGMPGSSAGSTSGTAATGATTGAATTGSTTAGTTGITGTTGAATTGSTTAGTAAAGTATTGTAAAGTATAGDAQARAMPPGSAHSHGMAHDTPPKASSPAEALTLVALVDQHELKLAQLTQSKQVSEPVREYATMMVNDHSKHLEKTRGLLEKAGGMQQNSAGAQQLMTMDRQTQQQLGGLEGDAYARAYMDHMVMSHRMGIDMVDASMSVATDPAQREFLQTTKQTMQKHLERAQQVQGQLGG